MLCFYSLMYEPGYNSTFFGWGITFKLTHGSTFFFFYSKMVIFQLKLCFQSGERGNDHDIYRFLRLGQNRVMIYSTVGLFTRRG